jgi:HSP20 family protein
MSPLVPARNRERHPYRDLDDIHLQMDRMFQQLLDPAALVNEAAWVPPVDIEETDDAWILEADLPGARRDDVNVEMQGDELVIHGEIKAREKTGILRRRARRVGAFEYRVRLLGEVDDSGIDATLSGGVLTVRIPKASREKHRIEVTEREPSTGETSSGAEASSGAQPSSGAEGNPTEGGPASTA